LGVLAAASRAGAHALLNRSDPPSGATLQQAPQAVTLTFTEAPEPTLSSVRILLPSGQQVPTGPLHALAGAPRTLEVTLGPLSTGVYTVNWRTVSRVDGHVTGGAFAFGVGTTPADIAVPEVTSPPPSVLGGAARWGLYAGLSVLLGAAWVWTIALPQAPGPGPASLTVVGVGAAGAVLARVAAGHAAAALGPSRPANVAAQWVHVMSVGAWLGGLAALLAALGATPNAEKAAAVRRFSAGAG